MESHRLSNTSTSTHRVVADASNGTGSALASANASLAHGLHGSSHNGLLIAQSVIRSIPESAPQILKTFPNELACDHGLGMLYLALQNNNPAQLPSPDFLLKDLNKICLVHVVKNNTTLTEPLKKIVNRFLVPALGMPVEGFAEQREHMVSLFNVSNVLIKSLSLEDAADGNLHELGSTSLKNLALFCEKLRNSTPADNPQHAELNALIRQIKKSRAIAIVLRNPIKLENLPATYRDNMDVVMGVVQQNGLALQYASAAMKSNRQVVLAAVQNNGLALEYANPNLRSNHEIVVAAMRQNSAASMHAVVGRYNPLRLAQVHEAPQQPQPPQRPDAGPGGNNNLRDILDEVLNMDL